jgi:hypothetical protein
MSGSGSNPRAEYVRKTAEDRRRQRGMVDVSNTGAGRGTPLRSPNLDDDSPYIPPAGRTTVEHRLMNLIQHIKNGRTFGAPGAQLRDVNSVDDLVENYAIHYRQDPASLRNYNYLFEEFFRQNFTLPPRIEEPASLNANEDVGTGIHNVRPQANVFRRQPQGYLPVEDAESNVAGSIATMYASALSKLRGKVSSGAYLNYDDYLADSSKLVELENQVTSIAKQKTALDRETATQRRLKDQLDKGTYSSRKRLQKFANAVAGRKNLRPTGARTNPLLRQPS